MYGAHGFSLGPGLVPKAAYRHFYFIGPECFLSLSVLFSWSNFTPFFMSRPWSSNALANLVDYRRVMSPIYPFIARVRCWVTSGVCNRRAGRVSFTIPTTAHSSSLNYRIVEYHWIGCLNSKAVNLLASTDSHHVRYSRLN